MDRMKVERIIKADRLVFRIKKVFTYYIAYVELNCRDVDWHLYYSCEY